MSHDVLLGDVGGKQVAGGVEELNRPRTRNYRRPVEFPAIFCIDLRTGCSNHLSSAKTPCRDILYRPIGDGRNGAECDALGPHN